MLIYTYIYLYFTINAYYYLYHGPYRLSKLICHTVLRKMLYSRMDLRLGNNDDDDNYNDGGNVA